MPQRPTDYDRFCPGEQEIRISDAVCMGRRRANFHKCPGCQFNDDEKGTANYAQATVRSASNPTTLPALETKEEAKMLEKVFKAYDVRATYPEPLNEDLAWRIGNATAQFLRTSLSGYDRSDAAMNTLIVGRDMRKSSLSLCQSFTEGARAVGASVIDIGLVDTPQISFATNIMPCCGGAQTTASHNPSNYNGFKISGPKGKPIGADTGLQEIQRIASAITRYDTPDKGAIRPMDLSSQYREYLLRFMLEPRKLRVAVDASNGMAGRWFPTIFDGVSGLDVIRLYFEHDGEFVHQPNPLVPANLDDLRAAVREHQADFGACFDGDADRCIFVDQNAEIIPCDLLAALLVENYLRAHPGATIVYDLRSSRIVPERIRELGGTPRRERVGHVFMKRSMSDTQAVFGAELSGHFYFKDFFYCDSGMMAFIQVMNTLTRTGQPLSALLRPLRKYVASGEQNFQNADKGGTFKRLADKYRSADIDYLDGITIRFPDWWCNIRPSNTEPLLRLNLEAVDQDTLDTRHAELVPLLGTPVDH